MKEVILTFTILATGLVAFAGPGDVGSVNATKITCEIFNHQSGVSIFKDIDLVSSNLPKEYLVVENGEGRIYVRASYTNENSMEQNEFALMSRTAGVAVEGASISYKQVAEQATPPLRMSISANNKLLTTLCNYSK